MKKNLTIFLLNFIVLFISVSSGSKVLELSDRFIDVYQNGLWLVKFYAPWCGHCKKLEPIWNQVAQDLHYSDIRVGRVDCTRFPNVASEFDIRGFPTILFFKGQKTFSYNGDRSREEIVRFSLRLERLPVQQLNSTEDLNIVKNKYDVFFLFVAKTLEGAGLLWNSYNYVAEQFQTSSYFFSLFLDSFPDQKPLQMITGQHESTSAVYVFKDDIVYNFKNISEDLMVLNASLTRWVQLERLPHFVKVTQGTFPLMMKTEKYLVFAVLEENLIGKFTPEMEEFKRIIKNVAFDHLEEFRENFMFGWMPQTSIANSVAMQHLEAPSLLVVNSLTYQYYVPDVEASEISPEIVVTFLRGILNNSERARGGNSIFSRIYRVYFDVTSTLFEMWAGNPVLTSVLFGLPFGFLSLICYSICCADILDANDDDESRDEDEQHEKKE